MESRSIGKTSNPVDPFDLDELVRLASKLPPLPQIAQRALLLIRDPDSNMSDIADVLAMDQVMTSLILRWANSSYYSLRSPLTTVRQAVSYLGQNMVQSLVLTASVATYFTPPVIGYGLDRGELWKHSISVATIARFFGTRIGRNEAEESYHAGLLCDIGKLVFDQALRAVNTTPVDASQSFDDLEVSLFGIDHATMGAIVAKTWKLPQVLITPIACHHQPNKAQEHRRITSAVHLADVFVNMMGIGIGKDGLQYRIDPVAMDELHIHPEDIPDLYDRATPLILQAEEMVKMNL